ncbi:SNF2-related protein [Ensifer adhaerens]|uniref:SNF2-related protein n=1 Tax=Ensifer adhaerens TaxID=106592 RepID=UPI001C4E178E|nr:SNF2-related protein [Ensifer adhaerens]MBW0365864.1 DEAD/DEAH box helicase [Ensifer adhaerens]UCM20231.1 DEAD/DEAH box helicase [Ensifer adhaerens]
MSTNYHSKYIAHDLTKLAPPGAKDQLSMSLFDASVDLNPHQIEAATFALQSPLAEGAILADEVGLGKTIEAGIVLCQSWAERKRKLIVICPAAIRQQWAAELTGKFNLPAVVLDAKTYRQMKSEDTALPLSQKRIVILSYHFAAKLQDELRQVEWDLVVLDEAHKLRNAYRPGNRIGQALQWAVEGRRKLLLTATPLQNSLMEIFGLTSFIDPNIFGDANSFRSKYVNAGGDLPELRSRLAGFCKRTLRKQVLEYVKYTKRRAITQPFSPAANEQALYDGITRFLQKEDTYAIPSQQRHLTVLILRKLLASSSQAIAGTLETLLARLEALAEGKVAENPVEPIVLEDEFDEEVVEAWDEIEETTEADNQKIDSAKLRREIEEIAHLIQLARSIHTDTKSKALLTALDVGFSEQQRMGALKKALIFTESRRTQEYLRDFLERSGYAGQVVTFSGTNSDRRAQDVYEKWVSNPKNSQRVSGSRQIDVRAALIDAFRDSASIMIATEAAAEGVNLQFCSQVINYDLPWNPQRIEQRIGRCHRYGQTHDVIVVNFLNERNDADKRVHALLTEKFNLFDGVFGASDEVLGTIESGLDFEKRILAIYQDCRTPQAIAAAFDELQAQLDEQIRSRMEDTRRTLLEHFDEDVHARLKLRLADAREQLDRMGRRFWDLTRWTLQDSAKFDQANLAFDLITPPAGDIRPGRYHLISRNSASDQSQNEHGYFLYRLSHTLGEHVIAAAKAADTPVAELRFDVSNHPGRVTIVEALKGRKGWLTLRKLTVTTFETEEYLLFSGIDENGRSIDHEACAKLFSVGASAEVRGDPEAALASRLEAEAVQHVKALLNQSLEANNKHFAMARDRLERWAEDKIYAAEKALKDTKEQIKGIRREARQATTLEEEAAIQAKLQELERRQRKQRQEIFNQEDEVAEKRDELIANLQKRLQRGHSVETLFTIRWAVV